ncbi:MAG: amidohydrolase [Acidobacteria bacterium]|nr:MAG: amidohydrolase [Acidobacteriota bacterium]REK09807.1 MAG: amidohydrolase [Acidobacteriota bacterium]
MRSPSNHPDSRRVAAQRLGCCLLLFSGALIAQDSPIAFVGAEVLPIAGDPIPNGVVVVQDGRIVAVGGAATAVPAGATTIDVAGKVLMPGLVDTHSHIGGPSGGDSSSAIHPETRALDAVDVRSDGFWRARAGGLTTLNVMPGSGLLMSGQTVHLKLRKDPRTIEDWLLCDDPIAEVCGSMKMANGTNSIRQPPAPGTRGKSAALVRQKYVQAQEYRDKLRDDRAGATPPARDLEMEALVEVLDGERIVQFHSHRHNDISTLLRLGREFGFTPVIQHGSEAWKVADQIAEAGVGVSLTFIDAFGGKEEALGWTMESGRLLEEAGVDVSFNTDDGITDSRFLLRAPAISVRYGMSRQKALEGVTLAPARQLGLADRVGSLEVGKDADLVILSGDPLSVYTRVEETWVEGERVFDLDDPEHRRYATGGYDVYRNLADVHVHDSAAAIEAGEWR